MAKTKSAKKALRQNIKRRQKNLIYKEKIKSLIKKIKSLVAKGKADEAKMFLPNLYKILDKAAKENIIKKNTAARKKSKIARLINSNLKTAS